MFLKLFLWGNFFAIIAFFVHKQLSNEVLVFEESIFIPGASKHDVYEYLADVKSSMQSYSHGGTVSDVVYLPGDNGEPDQIKFYWLEKFSIQGLYEQIVRSPCIAKLYPLIPKIQLNINMLEGLIHGTVSITFRDGSENGEIGTVVTESFEIISPNFFAKFIKDSTKSTHRLFLRNAKRHFKEVET